MIKIRSINNEREKKMKKTVKLTAMLLAAACSLVMFSGCPAKQDPTTTSASTDNTPASGFTGKLDGYTVVYPGFSPASVKESAAKLAKVFG